LICLEFTEHKGYNTAINGPKFFFAFFVSLYINEVTKTTLDIYTQR